ncbi:MAG: hypothetical protein AB1505_11635, partial [Candidatus Latescibacterota bacterium]
RCPLAVCLDDLQWADSASLDLFVYLATHGADARLLLVGASGPQSGESWLPAGTANWPAASVEIGALPHVEHVRLKPLTLAQVRELVLGCYPRSAFGEEVYEQLHRRSGGVPLFVVQQLEWLRSRGLLFERDGVWLAGRTDGEVPLSTHAVLQMRLQGLSPEQRRLLGYAAIQGEVFEGGPAAAACGLPAALGLRELGRVARRPELLASSGRGFRFAHPLLAEVCYRDLPEPQRRGGHQRLAELLAARQPQEVGLLAFHYSRARAHERAIPHLLEAGMQARAAFAYPEARGLLAQAVEHLDRWPHVRTRWSRVELLLILSELEESLGHWDLATSRCQQALELAPAHQRATVGRGLLRLGAMRYAQGEWEESLGHLGTALEVFAELGDATWQARVLAWLGRVQLEHVPLDQAAASFGRAHALALACKDQAALGEANLWLGAVRRLDGMHLEAVLHYTEAMQAFRRAGDEHGIGLVYGGFGALHLAQEGWAQALACYARSASQARRMGAAGLLAHTLIGQALAQLGSGDLEGAYASCLAARARLAEIRDRRGLAECHRVEGVILREKVRYAPAAEALEQGRSLYASLGSQLRVAECDREMGVLLQRRGDAGQARERLHQSGRLFAALGAAHEARKVEELLAGMAA